MKQLYIFGSTVLMAPLLRCCKSAVTCGSTWIINLCFPQRIYKHCKLLAFGYNNNVGQYRLLKACAKHTNWLPRSGYGLSCAHGGTPGVWDTTCEQADITISTLSAILQHSQENDRNITKLQTFGNRTRGSLAFITLG